MQLYHFISKSNTCKIGMPHYFVLSNGCSFKVVSPNISISLKRSHLLKHAAIDADAPLESISFSSLTNLYYLGSHLLKPKRMLSTFCHFAISKLQTKFFLLLSIFTHRSLLLPRHEEGPTAVDIFSFRTHKNGRALSDKRSTTGTANGSNGPQKNCRFPSLYLHRPHRHGRIVRFGSKRGSQSTHHSLQRHQFISLFASPTFSYSL
jgi:hypothetical protein